jgi:hypothetical protein
MHTTPLRLPEISQGSTNNTSAQNIAYFKYLSPSPLGMSRNHNQQSSDKKTFQFSFNYSLKTLQPSTSKTYLGGRAMNLPRIMASQLK